MAYKNLLKANKYHRKWRKTHLKACRKWVRDWGRKHPECAHKHKLKYRYGMTVEEYTIKLKEQNNVCAICKCAEIAKYRSKAPQHLSVDHNHKTGKNRGLLCDRCNRAIGSFRDDLKIVKSAVVYLQKWETNATALKILENK